MEKLSRELSVRRRNVGAAASKVARVRKKGEFRTANARSVGAKETETKKSAARPAEEVGLIVRRALGAGLADRVQHVLNCSDRFVRRQVRRRILASDGDGALTACGSARSIIQPCSSHSRMAWASSRTEIAQPCRVRIAARLSFISSVESLLSEPNPFSLSAVPAANTGM